MPVIAFGQQAAMETLRSARINQIARLIGAKRYLEVGVCNGTTFFEIDVAEKVAVDPVFQFDHRAAATERTRFHEMTSDAFFAATREGTFDLIYLDGLHTYEQTLRDLMHSLRLAHAGTVWILDDTVPNDCHAALPDEGECQRLRRVTGSGDWSWMGDVYKVVFFVNAMMKDFDYRTWTGHGQTVMWRIAPPFGIAQGLPLGEIDTLSYEDLLAHMEMMRPASDEEILAALSAAVLPKRTGPRALLARLRASTDRAASGG